MPITESIEALQRPDQDRKRRSSILSALLALLFLTAFLPLVLTSRYLVNQARADLEFDQRALQIAKVRHLSQWIAQFRTSTRAGFGPRNCGRTRMSRPISRSIAIGRSVLRKLKATWS